MVSLPTDPSTGLNDEERKRQTEEAVFRSFAVAADLRIVNDSITASNPPHPDIRCETESGTRWFELARIIPVKVAETTNPGRRKADAGFPFSPDEPFLHVAAQKQSKSYDTEGKPVELILHFDLRVGTAHTIEDWINEPAVRQALLQLCQKGPFSVVWLYDEHTHAIIWSSDRGSDPALQIESLRK